MLKYLFNTPSTNSLNLAYQLPAKEALAQAEVQLKEIVRSCELVDHDFIAKLAIYARKEGYMKDTPALLAAKRYVNLEKVFFLVINNGKMLRNFVQIIRSGRVGRKSFGTRIKRIIKLWLNSASDEKLIKAYVGNKPNLADIIKMVHVKGNEFYKWILGKEYNIALLPKEIQKFEDFKHADMEVPDVPFQTITNRTSSSCWMAYVTHEFKYISASWGFAGYGSCKIYRTKRILNQQWSS